ncbi:MAG TPA: phosphotransferase [Herpetosiphonaceae bacterium]|nr:phosphotransferase [Herpetosiphonaceae bacterium]
MSNYDDWRSIIHVAIVHPSEPAFLVERAGDAWRLPTLPVERMWEKPVSSVNEAARATLGLETIALQKIYGFRDDANKIGYRLYALENHSPRWQPPAGMRWAGADELDRLEWALPDQRPALESWLGELAPGAAPPLRPPWARPGWYAAASAWIADELGRLGLEPAGWPEQVKSWSLSCILRAPTAGGPVYFKVTNPSGLMANEAVVTAGLAELFPDVLPRLLATRPDQGWMLLADFGQEIGWEGASDIRAAALREFARLQQRSARHLDELLEIGVIDRRLPVLAAQLDGLLADELAMGYVDEQPRRELRAAAPALKELCARLERYAVPMTLVHGDIHMANVAPQADGFIFFDWTDACLSHPFMDAIDILHEEDAAVAARLRDSYLAMWAEYEPAERLEEMWRIARPLCALHQAVSYASILANTEDRNQDEFKGAMGLWVGKVLEGLT